MTLSSAEKAASPAQLNDLKRIKGIGRVKQQWLNDMLHITTLAELAELDIHDLELPSAGIITRAELTAWITQAQTLIGQASQDANELAPCEQSNESTEPEWITETTFNLVLQTRDRPDQPNAATRRLLLHHADLNGGAPLIIAPAVDLMHQIAELMPDPAAPAKSSALAVEIFQVTVQQNGKAIALHDDSHALTHPLRVNEPFSLMVQFRLSGTLPAGHGTTITHTTQCFARDRASGQSQCLATPDPTSISTNQFTYQVTLSDLEITRSGFYRLQILTTLQGTLAMPGCFELPMLQVC